MSMIVVSAAVALSLAALALVSFDANVHGLLRKQETRYIHTNALLACLQYGTVLLRAYRAEDWGTGEGEAKVLDPAEDLHWQAGRVLDRVTCKVVKVSEEQIEADVEIAYGPE